MVNGWTIKCAKIKTQGISPVFTPWHNKYNKNSYRMQVFFDQKPNLLTPDRVSGNLAALGMQTESIHNFPHTENGKAQFLGSIAAVKVAVTVPFKRSPLA
jgi:hypothetical protein